MAKNRFFDLKLLKFLGVGVLNTLFSAALMYLLYNLAGFGYWGSSAVSYILGSVLSFFLNRRFTFDNRDPIWKTALKFAFTVAVCYLIAYSIAKPAVAFLLSKTGLTENAVDQISLFVGMALFTLLNYTGQRFFAFRKKEEDR